MKKNNFSFFLIVLILPLLFTMLACDDHSTNPTNSCTDPAPLNGEFNPAATSYRVIVGYKDDIDHVAETNRLEGIYTLSSITVFEFISAFAAEVTPKVLSALRCEESIASINESIPVPPAG